MFFLCLLHRQLSLIHSAYDVGIGSLNQNKINKFLKNEQINLQTNKQTKGETIEGTRPDTRLKPVVDGWAGAEMCVFTLSDSC